MGRGRQKAKHTKVARELKYFSPDTNLDALERELAQAEKNESAEKWPEYSAAEDEYEDEYETESRG